MLFELELLIEWWWQLFFVVLFTLFMTPLPVRAADEVIETDKGYWAPITLRMPVYKRLEAYFEVQPRFQSTALKNISESILRPGLGLRLTKNLAVFAGYYWSSRFNEELDYDNRIWEQVSHSKKLGRWGIQNRFRLEHILPKDDVGKATRLRHQLRVTYDIPKTKLYLAASEEPFFFLNSQENGPKQGFNQNRLTIAIGRRLNKYVRAEVGYLNQYRNNRGRPDLMNHVLVTAVNIELERFSPKKAFKLAQNFGHRAQP